MLIDECIRDLQKYTIEKITYDKIAKALGLKGKQSISNRIARKQALKDSEIKLIYDYFKIDKSKDDNCITLEHISINPSCGKGTEIMDEPDITPVQIGINLIKTIFKISQPKNLKTFTAAGDSMNPIIEHGDILLVDVGDIDFVNGGVFLLTIDNNWYVKRLRKRITGELDIISDNTKYPVETLQMDTFKEVKIRGRVIKNLSRGL